MFVELKEEEKKSPSVMDDVEIEDTSPASILPDEMLTRIFKFLPLTDRKSVRLVSRSWYHCCSCVNITKHEKFVFRTDARIEDVTDVILRSTHSQLDLEFQCLSVSDLPADLWKACSRQIRMLKFHECSSNDETIANIILHCENLTSFHVPTPFRNAKEDPSEDTFSPRLVDGLIKKGIRRPNLHTLSILTSLVNVQEGIFSKISLIYPCIKHFSFTVFGSKDHMNLDQCLNPEAPLESLTYDALEPTNGKWMETQAGHQGLRLKRLEMLFFLSRSTKDVIFNFFKLQRNLEVIRLNHIVEPMETLETVDEDKIKVLFFHILENCPNLREFHLTDMHLKYSEVPRFLTSISKLNFLSFNCKLSGSEHLSRFLELPTNPVRLNLTTLKWVGFPYDDADSCIAFLQRCPCLQHLYLRDGCDTTLQTIFKYLPGLRTLVVFGTKNYTDFGFTGRDVDGNESGYSIKSLHQLKYLRFFGFDSNMTERTVIELRLPRLESLSLEVELYKQLSKETLNELASHLPELRVLAITFNPDDEHFMVKTIQFCKQLKNLQRLAIIPRWCWSECSPTVKNRRKELSERIFNSCNNGLKYISWLDIWVSFRDPSTGEVLQKDWSLFKFSNKNIFDPNDYDLT